MPHNEQLAARMRQHLGARPGVVEKKMFGGVAFLVHGNMCVGVHKDDLVVRIDPAESDAALAEPGVRIFDITGRPMKGWLLVNATAIANDATLAAWLDRGFTFASSLPAK